MGGAERGDRHWHQGGAGGGEGGHAQLSAAQPGDRRELGLGDLQPREDALCVGHEGATGGCGAHAAGAALDQRHTDFVLQRGDLLGDGGLGVGELLCGG